MELVPIVRCSSSCQGRKAHVAERWPFLVVFNQTQPHFGCATSNPSRCPQFARHTVPSGHTHPMHPVDLTLQSTARRSRKFACLLAIGHDGIHDQQVVVPVLVTYPRSWQLDARPEIRLPPNPGSFQYPQSVFRRGSDECRSSKSVERKMYCGVSRRERHCNHDLQGRQI